MATVWVGAETITVRLSAWEKFASLRGTFTVPRSAVRSVHAVDNGIAEIHGWRAPGGAIPGVWLVGTFRDGGSRTFAAWSRARPRAVVIGLARSPTGKNGFDRLVLAVDDPDAVVAELTRTAPISPSSEGPNGP
jgi:hypothetical protein